MRRLSLLLGLLACAFVYGDTKTNSVFNPTNGTLPGSFTTLSASGLITPTSSIGIAGTTAGDTPQAGSVGEVYSINCVVGAAGAAATNVTTPVASPGVVTWSSAPFSASPNVTNWACPINFTTSGALPTGLTVGTNYFIIGTTYSAVAGTFQVATSVANALTGTAVNFTGSTSGQSGAYVGNALTSVNNYTGAAIALAAGDWDCHGLSEYQELTTLTSSRYIAGISTAATLGSIGTYTQDMRASGSIGANSVYLPTPVVQQNLSSSTGIYLNIGSSFSAGTANGAGTFYCRRGR